ncbi:MAG: HDOD domain-containing protein [Syntrophobacteraceae bacterium]|nr:HDOD domain-containing protein [Syntrophobacteraceae bacterium]
MLKAYRFDSLDARLILIQERGFVSEQTASMAEKIVQATGDLPTMPHVASMVLQKLGNPNTSPKELHQTISADQALAARVLKVANSPLYGCSRAINRLTDAVVIMGFDSLRSLVMSSVMQDLFKSFGLTEKLLWEHSFGCAAISKHIAKVIKYPKVEEAFLAGLLHDIGKVVLNLKIPDKTREIVQEVYNNPGISFMQAEQEMFGFNHAQVGKLIAKKWNFAETIEETIGCHHDPRQARILPVLTVIVNFGNLVCHKLEVGPTRNPDLDLFEFESTRLLRFNEESLGKLMAEVGELMAEKDSMLAL